MDQLRRSPRVDFRRRRRRGEQAYLMRRRGQGIAERPESSQRNHIPSAHALFPHPKQSSHGRCRSPTWGASEPSERPLIAAPPPSGTTPTATDGCRTRTAGRSIALKKSQVPVHISQPNRSKNITMALANSSTSHSSNLSIITYSRHVRPISYLMDMCFLKASRSLLHSSLAASL